MRGRLDEAAKVLDDGVEAGRLSGITQSMAWTLRNRALLSVVAGDLDAALDMAEEAHELTRRLDQSVLTSWAAMAVARASVMAGQSQRAIDVLAGDEAMLMAIPGAWRAMGLDALASAYADLGRVTRPHERRRAPKRMPPRSAFRWRSPGPSMPPRWSPCTPASTAQPPNGRWRPRRPPRRSAP